MLLKGAFMATVFTIVMQSIILLVLQAQKEDTNNEISKLETIQIARSASLPMSNIFINQAQMLLADLESIDSEGHYPTLFTSPSFVLSDSVKMLLAASYSMSLEDFMIIMSIRSGDDLDGAFLPEDVEEDMESILESTYGVTEESLTKTEKERSSLTSFSNLYSKIGQRTLENFFKTSNTLIELTSKKDRIQFWITITMLLAISFQILTVIFVFTKDIKD